MGALLRFPRRHNVMAVQPCKGGFEVTLVTSEGRYEHRGTRERLDDARTLATHEALRVGRCRVQIMEALP